MTLPGLFDFSTKTPTDLIILERRNLHDEVTGIRFNSFHPNLSFRSKELNLSFCCYFGLIKQCFVLM